MEDDYQALFREYMRLTRRKDELSVEEYDRWTELKARLAARFQPGEAPRHDDRRESVRVPASLKLTFESYGAVTECLMTNLSRGGMFVRTHSPMDIGTKLQLRIRIEEEDNDIELTGEVVSHDTGPDLISFERGMGIRFLQLDDAQAAKIDLLYSQMGVLALERASEVD